MSGFRGVALTNCFSSIFHFGQTSKFKKGKILSKNNGIKISSGYAHLNIKSFITTKFHGILLSGFRGVALTRKTGLTDLPTNGRVKNIILPATGCMGYNYCRRYGGIKLFLSRENISFNMYQYLITEIIFRVRLSVFSFPVRKPGIFWPIRWLQNQREQYRDGLSDRGASL